MISSFTFKSFQDAIKNMTHSFQNSLLLFNYDDAVEENRNNVVYNTLLSLHATLQEKESKGIFISLKNAPRLNNDHHLEHLVKQMDKLSLKLKIPVALGDYKRETFAYLKKISAHTQVKLFQNINAAVLFLNPRFFKKQLSVLLYDEDEANADRLSAELLKLSYSVTHTKTIDDFKAKASAKVYDMTITQNCLNLAKSSLAAQPSLSLSKELILNLPVFIDTAVDSLVTITGLEAQKIKHAVREFDTQIDSNILIASMKFKGDISGNFFLVFPRSLAQAALEAMLGESVDGDDTTALVDGIAELCNIITGGAKTTFSAKQIKVLFELPKTYISLQLALKDTSEGNGIWIEMQLQNKPFYMFVTK